MLINRTSAAKLALPIVTVSRMRIFVSPRTLMTVRGLASIVGGDGMCDGSRSPKLKSVLPLRRATKPADGLQATLKIKGFPPLHGTAFGARGSASGETVFTTGPVGYVEALTDPSYRGQILVFAQPLIGNYGVPDVRVRDLQVTPTTSITAGSSSSLPPRTLIPTSAADSVPNNNNYNNYSSSVEDDDGSGGLLRNVESPHMQPAAVVVAVEPPARGAELHWAAVESLSAWCAREGVPGIAGVDTRSLIIRLRDYSNGGDGGQGKARPALGRVEVYAAGEETTVGVIEGEGKGKVVGARRVGMVREEQKKHPSVTSREWDEEEDDEDDEEGFINTAAHDVVPLVSTKVPFRVLSPFASQANKANAHIAVIECGVKESILRGLVERGATVTVVPYDFPIDDAALAPVFATNLSSAVSAHQPPAAGVAATPPRLHGVLYSNGPGDPNRCNATEARLRRLLQLVGAVPMDTVTTTAGSAADTVTHNSPPLHGLPIMGICMGHQLLARAAGARTCRLKHGHRAHNVPTMDVLPPSMYHNSCSSSSSSSSSVFSSAASASSSSNGGGGGRCIMTSQNHGYAVDASTLPPQFVESFVNLNDGSNEGVAHVTLPVFSVQFHPEAAPGPRDAAYLFDRFMHDVRGYAAAAMAAEEKKMVWHAGEGAKLEHEQQKQQLLLQMVGLSSANAVAAAMAAGERLRNVVFTRRVGVAPDVVTRMEAGEDGELGRLEEHEQESDAGQAVAAAA